MMWSGLELKSHNFNNLLVLHGLSWVRVVMIELYRNILNIAPYALQQVINAS